ncbi:MAG: hypothetical protein EBS00_06515 [Verrucomicrobia bacterium]|nr:hypothetical protein [Verrucomicrobiota bacterium]
MWSFGCIIQDLRKKGFKETIYLTNKRVSSMLRQVLPICLMFSLLKAGPVSWDNPGQSPSFKKTPETLKTEVEAELIRAKLDLASAQRHWQQMEHISEIQKLEAEEKLRKAKVEGALINQDLENAELSLKVAIANAQANVASAQLNQKREEFEAETKLALAQAAITFEKIARIGEIADLQKKWNQIAINKQISYPLDPVVDGVLRISNRRISFNGVVNDELAKDVCERIAFYNALDSQAPIFIVIDRSPGGSVMSGYQILQAMEASRAPVYVVVKGYAASMAAIITTLANRSYVYPQTIVLHHQASTSLSGNNTQLAQQLKWTKVWCDRIFIKVADKVGLSLDEFVSRMYAATVTGDWKVLGDEAVKLKWVTHVVERMTEEGASTMPTPPAIENASLKVATSRQELPPLNPFDVWWIYDPTTEFILR